MLNTTSVMYGADSTVADATALNDLRFPCVETHG